MKKHDIYKEVKRQEYQQKSKQLTVLGLARRRAMEH
jgi:hypothetical protein